MRNNNLLKNEPKVYEMKSSEREVYETQSCFQLRVMDGANLITEIAKENEVEETDVIEKLYDGMKNYHLYKILDRTVDPSKYNVEVKISAHQRTRTARVEINKRRVRDKIRNGIKSFLSEFAG